VDCVWQMSQQFPCIFQFNEKFLLRIVRHLYDCRFGTFLCNNERERATNQIRQCTVSLWSYVNDKSNRHDFVNPFYLPQEGAFFPDLGVENMQLWKRFYFRSYSACYAKNCLAGKTLYPMKVPDRMNPELRARQLLNVIDRMKERIQQLDEQLTETKSQKKPEEEDGKSEAVLLASET